MSEVRDNYTELYLTDDECELLKFLCADLDLTYSEIVGKALRAYHDLDELIKLYENGEY